MNLAGAAGAGWQWSGVAFAAGAWRRAWPERTRPTRTRARRTTNGGRKRKAFHDHLPGDARDRGRRHYRPLHLAVPVLGLGVATDRKISRCHLPPPQGSITSAATTSTRISANDPPFGIAFEVVGRLRPSRSSGRASASGTGRSRRRRRSAGRRGASGWSGRSGISRRCARGCSASARTRARRSPRRRSSCPSSRGSTSLRRAARRLPWRRTARTAT